MKAITKKGKEVSLLELFFDLIFVYAVAKLTAILENVQGGYIPVKSILLYFLAAMVVLQMWLYQTNYNNRFAEGRWYENLVMIINMAVALFMANIIGDFTDKTMLQFDITMIVMLTGIGFLYFTQYKSIEVGKAESKTFSIMMFIISGVYIIAIALLLLPISNKISYTVTGITVVTGAILPSFLRRDFNTHIVDFPHLTERFELLTIVTFGEAITSLGAYFYPGSVTYVSISAFAIIIFMFGCYVVHNHYMINRNADTRGLTLMFSHYAITIAINIITVGQTLILEGEIHSTFFTGMMIIGTLGYFFGLYLNSVYYCRKIWSKAEIALLALPIVIGTVTMLIFRGGIACLFSMLFMSFVEFILLFTKAKRIKIKCRED